MKEMFTEAAEHSSPAQEADVMLSSRHASSPPSQGTPLVARAGQRRNTPATQIRRGALSTRGKSSQKIEVH